MNADVRKWSKNLYRATGWPEIFALKDIFAKTVAKNLHVSWIVRYGCPIRVNNRPGVMGQWRGFIGLLKAALMARSDQSTWVEELLTVLLGLRAAPRSDTGVSAAELVFGKNVKNARRFL
ncbi:hypothetical protein ACJJTC_012515 [Scirpophaga incertulas]